MVELAAPAGKFRVVGVDLFSHEDYLMGDYSSRAEAFKVADDHNTKRSGSMDDILTTSTTIRARTSGAMRRSARKSLPEKRKSPSHYRKSAGGPAARPHYV